MQNKFIYFFTFAPTLNLFKGLGAEGKTRKIFPALSRCILLSTIGQSYENRSEAKIVKTERNAKCSRIIFPTTWPMTVGCRGASYFGRSQSYANFTRSYKKDHQTLSNSVAIYISPRPLGWLRGGELRSGRRGRGVRPLLLHFYLHHFLPNLHDDNAALS